MVSMTPVILTLDAAERVCAEHGWAFEIHPTLYGRTVQVWGDAGYTENSRMGRKYAVGAITSGCLCQLNAHYLKRRPKRVWQHGTALATIDLKGTDVWFDNIAFQHVGAQLVAVSEGIVIAQPAAASAVTAQAA